MNEEREKMKNAKQLQFTRCPLSEAHLEEAFRAKSRRVIEAMESLQIEVHNLPELANYIVNKNQYSVFWTIQRIRGIGNSWILNFVKAFALQVSYNRYVIRYKITKSKLIDLKTNIMKTEEIKQLISAHFKMPANIKFYWNAANNDLYNGPRGVRDDDSFPWRGFVHATKIVKDWCDETLNDIWLGTDSGDIVNREPEPEMVEGEVVEPYWPSISHYDTIKIKKLIFGSELYPYV